MRVKIMSDNNNSNNDFKPEVGHFEIPADNVDGLGNFYSSLFGREFIFYLINYNSLYSYYLLMDF